MKCAFLFALAVITPSQAVLAQTEVADLGRCELELGGVIKDCRLGYRTVGTLAPDGRNAVLIPTWFASSADAWLPLLGPDGVVDTTSTFVIIVESLGAGSSSSPSTSRLHPGVRFPELTVGDMVETSYRLSREHLALPELAAVVGISLGGLQAFEWAVSRPDYVRAIVAIAGAPRQALYQRSVWEIIARTADDAVRGKISREEAAEKIGRMAVLITTSPRAVNEVDRSRYDDYLANEIQTARDADLWEWAWQGRAIVRHDVARKFGGDLRAAARQWQGPALVVISTQDHSISPEPAEEFSALTGAQILRLEGPLGHSAIFTNAQAQAAVRNFLKRHR